jgi:hypothetical protein
MIGTLPQRHKRSVKNLPQLRHGFTAAAKSDPVIRCFTTAAAADGAHSLPTGKKCV